MSMTNGNGGGSTPARSTRSTRSQVSTPSHREAPTPTRSTVSHQGQGALSSPAMSKVSAVSGVSSLGLASLSPASKGTSSPSRRGPGGFAADIDLRSPLNYGTPSTHGKSRASRDTPANRTPNRTPIQQRADINSDRRLRQINIVRNDQEEQPHLVIWGTDVSASDFKAKFKRFIESYKRTADDAEDDEFLDDFEDTVPIYLTRIHEIREVDVPYLDVDCSHLMAFDQTAYQQLICYPQEVIPTMDMVVNEIFFDLYPDKDLAHQIQVRPYNVDHSKTIRFLNPEDIDQLVTISGMIIRTSNIIPEMKEGYFKCTVCSYGATAEIDRGRIIEPILCPNCNTNYTFTIIHNRSSFVDKQMVRLQEELEDTPPGETPAMVTLFAHHEMVNSVQPGDRVSVTGIYRAAPLRLNPRMRSVRSVYKTHIDVVHFKKVQIKKLREEEKGKKLNLSAERIALIKDLSRKEDIYERLARSIAPSIYEHEDVKKGILLQLFGGTRKEFSTSGRGHFRSEINILLCGDPGTSKSQLLKYVHDLVPRSQYTSGKGSSAVGLTAYITKDPETKQIVLQTGALVMADNGICCIDEFDKMSESSRSVLHEVMEQQTLSIAKAGIICQLNARASILAAANPLESQWNAKKTIVENVHLPHTLLSRFDLIFLLLDPQSDTYDRRLGRHMISLYFSNEEADADETMDPSVLRDYIAYAKENIQPKLNEDASHRLVSAYVEMRKAGGGHGQITAYPRQLESLIRLSEAHAKVRLSQVVELADVEEAWRLHREAVKQSATDPLSGKIDVSILTTGISTAARKRKVELVNAIKAHLTKGKGKKNWNYQDLLLEIKGGSSWSITREMFEDSIKQLQDEGFLIFGKSTIKLLK